MMEREIPKGWIEIRIEELTTIVAGGTPSTSKSEYFDGEIPWITPADLSGYKEKYIGHGRKSITELGLRNSSARLLPKDSILFSSRAPIGYVAIAKNSLTTNQGFKTLLPNDAFDSSYAYYYLKSIKQYAESQASGTTFKELSGKKMGELLFPLPPLPEQKRIVAKLDAAFAHLDVLQTSLKRIPELLKSFRQAVLTQAVTGKLTEESRETHQRSSGEIVLEEVIRKRKQNWIDRSLAEFYSKGKLPSNDSWKNKYPAPFILSSKIFTDLPDSWAETVWDQAADWVTYGFTRPMPHTETGIPIITGKNVVDGRISFETSHLTSEKAYEELNDKDRPRKGDLLITKDGTIGRAAIVETEIPFCINQSVAVAWLKNSPLERKYLLYVVMCEEVQNEIKLHTKGVAVQHLSVTDFRKMHLPVPPLEEQQEIVRRVQALFAKADAIEAGYLSLKQKTDSLPQALLAKAFRGELVAQEASDEPAAVLLERIKKAAAAGGVKSTIKQQKLYEENESISLAAEG